MKRDTINSVILVFTLVISVASLVLFALTVAILDGEPVPIPGDAVDRSWIELTALTGLGFVAFLTVSLCLPRSSAPARQPRHRGRHRH